MLLKKAPPTFGTFFFLFFVKGFSIIRIAMHSIQQVFFCLFFLYGCCTPSAGHCIIQLCVRLALSTTTGNECCFSLFRIIIIKSWYVDEYWIVLAAALSSEWMAVWNFVVLMAARRGRFKRKIRNGVVTSLLNRRAARPFVSFQYLLCGVGIFYYMPIMTTFYILFKI